VSYVRLAAGRRFACGSVPGAGLTRVLAATRLPKREAYATIGRHGAKPDAILRVTRREFVAALGGAAGAWPFVLHAQPVPAQLRRVGVLMNNSTSDADALRREAIFAKALNALGWKQGENLSLDVRWSEGDRSLMKQYAAEIIGVQPNVILAASTSNLAALLENTRTIPIVFVQVSDPVAQGLVSDLTHPGGNITGFSGFEFSLGGKWLDLLKQIAPSLTRVFIVFNPDTSPQSKYFQRSIEAAGPSFGLDIAAAPVRSDAEIDAAIENAAQVGIRD
jgi:ABC-type uncharacterized transport system substrate-binding protein